MTPEELEQEAARMENEAHVQLALGFINFQRQIGGAEALRTQARKERSKPKVSDEPLVKDEPKT